jgi:hypothetical protein
MNAFVSAFGLVKGAFTSAFGPSAAASGTYEVTVQPIEPASYYDVGPDEDALYLAISKTSSVRYLFILQSPGSALPNYTDYTNAVTLFIGNEQSATQLATQIYNAAIAVGFNVTRDGSTLTFTASQTGNLTDSVGFPTPTITNGS